MKSVFRDLAVAFAAANIFSLSAWIDYEKVYTAEFYFAIGGPPDGKYGHSITALIFILTLCIFCALQFRRRIKHLSFRALLEIGFIVSYILLILNAGELLIAFVTSAGYRWEALALFILLNTIMLGTLLKGRAVALRMAETFILLFLPFSLFKVADTTTGRRLSGPGADFDNKRVNPLPVSDASIRRIVWILFDEMDQSLTFSARPAHLHLPEFDRLRNESIHAERAVPAERQTINVVLSLLSGRRISSVSPLGPSDAKLEYADGSASGLISETHHLYTKMRRSGLHSAVVGGYLPYCQLFGPDLDSCHWEPTPDAFPAHIWYNYLTSMRVLPGSREIFWRQLAQLFGVFDLTLLPGVQDRQEKEQVALLGDHHAIMFRNLRKAALEILEKDYAQFVMIHVPIPHPPPIYDSASGKVGNFPSSTYLDNYILADVFLGQVRARLTETNRWDETTLLVTSDHSLRPDVWEPTPYWTDELRSVAAGSPLAHVPFMLKLSGQTEGVDYRPEFNSIVIHDLLVGLAAGEIATPDDVFRLLDRADVN